MSKQTELKLMYLIAQKNWLTALANQELSLGGWRTDYTKEQLILDCEIEDLLRGGQGWAVKQARF